jgi:exosome complex component RRP4
MNRDIIIDREVVIPGDLLSESPNDAGEGTYVEEGKVYASRYGVVDRRAKIRIIPLAGKYVPCQMDMVIGKIIDIDFPKWVVDINSPYKAVLHVSECPIRINFGEMNEYIGIGDLIYAKVKDASPEVDISLTLLGNKLGVLRGGRIVKILYSKVPRLVGRAGSMINMLKRECNCSIFVGQNGVVWINGSDEESNLMIKTILKIEREAHTSGLTERVSEFLHNGRKNGEDTIH